MDIENKKLATNDVIVKYFNDGVTKALSEYFDVKCCEKGHDWFTPWEGHQRKAFDLYALKGYMYIIRWGYNYDFIPTRKNGEKFIYHRTEKAVAVHIPDSFYLHVDYDPDKMSHNETLAIREKYCLSSYNLEYMNLTDVASAYEYIQEITRRNIPFMLEFFDRIRTIDDAVAEIDRRLEYSSDFPNVGLYYKKAFLHAYRQEMDKAVNSLEKLYENGISESIMARLEKAYEAGQSE
ncbi:MAG: hypothetical protein HDT25_08970 [Ruminococcus sp.]|nr:hypothetical protein [Ruminococcus sp.]